MEHIEENWKDSHSVTCAYCGKDADERETTRLGELGCSELEQVTGEDYGEPPSFTSNVLKS